MAAVLTPVAIDHQADGGSGIVLLAAEASNRFEIPEFLLTADGTGRVKLVSGSTVLTAMEVTAGGGAIKTLNYPLTGNYNEALKVVVVGGVNVSGHVMIKRVAKNTIT